MNPKIPHCQRCGTNIPPEEAVPYIDRFGRRIPGLYRNWCLVHWANRTGALPPTHPDFFKPLDPRTRRRDNKILGQMVGYAAIHGQSPIAQQVRLLDPSLAPSPDSEVKQQEKQMKPSVTSYLARTRGFISLFDGFENLGAWLKRNIKDMEENPDGEN